MVWLVEMDARVPAGIPAVTIGVALRVLRCPRPGVLGGRRSGPPWAAVVGTRRSGPPWAAAVGTVGGRDGALLATVAAAGG